MILIAGPEEGKLMRLGHCKCIIKGEERITAQCAKQTLRSVKHEHSRGGEGLQRFKFSDMQH